MVHLCLMTLRQSSITRTWSLMPVYGIFSGMISGVEICPLIPVTSPTDLSPCWHSGMKNKMFENICKGESQINFHFTLVDSSYKFAGHELYCLKGLCKLLFEGLWEMFSTVLGLRDSLFIGRPDICKKSIYHEHCWPSHYQWKCFLIVQDCGNSSALAREWSYHSLAPSYNCFVYSRTNQGSCL